MFTNKISSRTVRTVRLLALAAALAVTAVPAASILGAGTTAQAQQSSRGGGGGGPDGSSPNPVLKCLGPSCIDVSKAQACTHAYCKEEKEEYLQRGCQIRVCELEDGRRACRTEISYDERICTKMKI